MAPKTWLRCGGHGTAQSPQTCYPSCPTKPSVTHSAQNKRDHFLVRILWFGVRRRVSVCFSPRGIHLRGRHKCVRPGQSQVGCVKSHSPRSQPFTCKPFTRSSGKDMHPKDLQWGWKRFKSTGPLSRSDAPVRGGKPCI